MCAREEFSVWDFKFGVVGGFDVTVGRGLAPAVTGAHAGAPLPW